MAYYEDENPEGAITNIFMESRDKGYSGEAGTVKKNHDGKYLDYTHINIDLNRGANDKGKALYLWYTRDETLPPITGIDIARDEPENVRPDWNSVCWQNTSTPANANHGTKKAGRRIYIKFRWQ